ncbi:MAG TPA: c-type cytochrome, partial [Planctomycetaceae bacterium]|nr:c-type cytochrome [Planctomycetaceae bacterium]
PTGHVKVDSLFRPTSGVWVLAFAVVNSDFDGPTEFVLGSDDQAVLWVNGQKVYEFLGNRGWNANAAKVKVDLKKGENLVYFQCGNTGGGWDYSLQVSQRDPRFTFLFENVPQKLDPAAYVDFGTKNKGNPERGRSLFADTKGIGCIKCHAVGGEGGKIGPDLTGVGAKYPREELMRSVLEPSNRIAMGYEMTTIVTVDGRVINAIVKSETAEEIELADAEGKIIKLKPDDIDERVKSNLSMMPNGLKDGLTLQDFADIIAYLESLKQSAPAVGK